ncbi:MAG: ubiquinone/menaquinone biosynthesis methyltransferase [Armatimonadetes bacterium]|nr:ubiquinone/menaquinone biosynthesis methyltransferase [Armatimonadota bacterium]MBS1710583.1 ubiquinone/menaquinone biosynthesis methyltransferase [Armatimonadota bacterium]MBX3108254.1 ubiquinone/menaquinone biosynthesis methyltransferase [Fimbriimonadaceae bacterium]
MAQSTQTPPWEAEGAEKREAVRGLFADIAPTYDLANSIMSARGHYRWRAEACRLIGLTDGESVLDLCCGTGDFLVAAKAAVGQKGSVAGLDFCAPMLAIAAQKLAGSADLMLADATELPIASSQFDAVTVGWGLRNVPDIGKTLREAARVLKPGGRFVSVDMSEPKGFFGPVSRWAYHVSVPLLGRILRKPEAYAYLPKSTERFMDRQQLTKEIEAAGFTRVHSTSRFFGNIAIHWGVKA